MLLRVPAGRATGEPGIREILGVRLPRLTCGREGVGKVAGVDDAVGAVARDPVRRAGDEREVVREARMRHGVVLRQGRVAARERVERRRVGVAGDRRRLVVLEDDDNHVGEVRQPHGGRRHLRDGRAHRAARATGSEEPREREGQRDSARYSRFSSHFLPKWVKKKPIRTTAGDRDGGVDPVALDRVGRGGAPVVGDEPDRRRPADAAGGVPEEEPPPRHPRDARRPGGREAQNADETAEEDHLAAVLRHQPLRLGEESVRVPAPIAGALEEAASAEPTDQRVAEVVADDRGRRRRPRSPRRSSSAPGRRAPRRRSVPSRPAAGSRTTRA